MTLWKLRNKDRRDVPGEPLTAGQAHNRLIAAIDYELDHYGAASLADVVATVLSARPDTYHQEAHRMFQELSVRLNLLPRPVIEGSTV